MICFLAWCLAAFLYAMGAVNMMLLVRDWPRIRSIRPIFAMIIWPFVPFWALMTATYDHFARRPY